VAEPAGEISPARAACEAYGEIWANQGPSRSALWEDAAKAAIEAAPQDPMWEQAYMEVQSVLDEALGSGEDDGAGAGIAADVLLLVAQRDEARAVVREMCAVLAGYGEGGQDNDQILQWRERAGIEGRQ
jgi:hypothetical protein